MIKIGIGVEGPSDREFWNRLLHRHFAGETVRFEVRVMHGRTKLINSASRLLAAFGATGCRAVFLLLDKDKDRCITSVYEEFDEEFRPRLKGSSGHPLCRLCVADRELESWFMADDEAMRKVLGLSPDFAFPGGERITGKGKLQKLLTQHASIGAAFNEIAIAQRFASEFRAENAVKNSPSFAYFWNKLTSVINNAIGAENV